MKYIKEFESTFNEPIENDYVILSNDALSNELNSFLSNNIGQISSIDLDSQGYRSYNISYNYKDIPKEMRKFFYNNKHTKESYLDEFEVNLCDIKHWSTDKKDLKLILAAQKYNL